MLRIALKCRWGEPNWVRTHLSGISAWQPKYRTYCYELPLICPLESAAHPSAESINLNHLLGDKNYSGEDWLFSIWEVPLGKHLKSGLRDWRQRHFQSDNKAIESVAVLLRNSGEFSPSGRVGLGVPSTTQALPDTSKWSLSVMCK